MMSLRTLAEGISQAKSGRLTAGYRTKLIEQVFVLAGFASSSRSSFIYILPVLSSTSPIYQLRDGNCPSNLLLGACR